ncbi:MAG: peptide MFS transporter [bacterium]|nr:peptide MFS transporter [bacterium]
MKKTAFLRQMPGTMYSACVMELFERLAYYGFVTVLSIYLVEHLGIVRADVYGLTYGIFSAVLYFLPVIAGALADRYGYKPALAIAFCTLTGGYSLLASTTSFPLICVALGFIACGGSIIKPTIAGTVTHTTEEGSTRPVGFGIYYMTVNIGGLFGPVIAAQVRTRTEFQYVFWVSAAACALMFIQALVAFREPISQKDRNSGKSLGAVFAEMAIVLSNWRFVALLVIFSGFWGMINVIYGFLPLFVSEFTDLTHTAALIDRVIPVSTWAGDWLQPEVFISLDALLIVLFQTTISYLTRRWPTIRALLVGCTIAMASWILPAISPIALFVGLGITVWSIGEMTCSARFFEYCGTIAPKDKVAVYLGYSFLSLFLGNLYSGPWVGWLYENFLSTPIRAGNEPQTHLFFGGVMLMGLFTVVGLILYKRFAIGQEAGQAEA